MSSQQFTAQISQGGHGALLQRPISRHGDARLGARAQTRSAPCARTVLLGFAFLLCSLVYLLTSARAFADQELLVPSSAKIEPSEELKSSPAARARVRIAGFLRANRSESIRAPYVEEWRFSIVELIPEGSRVEPGDIVATFEGENLKRQLSEFNSLLAQAKVRGEQKLADIRTSLEDISKNVAEAEQELALLRVARQPDSQASREWLQSARERLIEELDIESRSLNLRLNREKLARKQRLLKIATASVEREQASYETQLEQVQKQLDTLSVQAKTAGIVVHTRSGWERVKLRVGSSTFRGTEIAAVVDERDLYVEGFLREEDLRHIRKGSRLLVKILGQRVVQVPGEIESISSIVLRVSDWDRSLSSSHPLYSTRAFRVRVRLDSIPAEAHADSEVEMSPLLQEDAA